MRIDEHDPPYRMEIKCFGFKDADSVLQIFALTAKRWKALRTYHKVLTSGHVRSLKDEILEQAKLEIVNRLYGPDWQSHDEEAKSTMQACRKVDEFFTAIRGGVFEIAFHERPEVVTYPRFWELLRFLLGGKLREQVFAPAYNDLLADYLTTRAVRFQTPGARRWIKVCFAVRTAVLVAQCVAVGLRGGIGAVLFPHSWRESIVKWWHGE